MRLPELAMDGARDIQVIGRHTECRNALSDNEQMLTVQRLWMRCGVIGFDVLWKREYLLACRGWQN